MNREEIKREWFAAVRDAADTTIGKLPAPPAMGTLSRVKTDILFRQYLYNGLFFVLGRAEGLDRMTSMSICEEIYTDLIEDVVSGLYDPKESMEVMGFMKLCSDSLSKPAVFAELLRRASGSDISDAEAASLKTSADQELARFAEIRKAK